MQIARSVKATSETITGETFGVYVVYTYPEMDPVYIILREDEAAPVEQLLNSMQGYRWGMFDLEILQIPELSGYDLESLSRVWHAGEWNTPLKELERLEGPSEDEVEAYARRPSWHHLDNEPPSGHTNLDNEGGITFCY